MSQQPETEQPRRRISWWWWILMLALLAWNIWAFWPRAAPEAPLTYSDFFKQVEANNVASVTISGSTIVGQFVTPIVYPSSTPAPTAGATAGATPGATPPASTAGPTTAPATPQTYTGFRTTYPEIVGDTTLVPTLLQHNVQVTNQNPSPLLSTILTYALPLLFLVGLLLFMGRQASQSQAGIFSFGRSKPRVHQGNRSDVTFADVAGADEAKMDLQEVVDFLRHPQKYHDVGARIPRGVLLVGPPGTGKTLLARAVAGEAEVPFFSISASEFVEMFVGVGASRVRDLFTQAKTAAPSIMFIDELDAVGRRRGAGLGTVNDEREQTLNQLLVEMDGFDERHEVIVLAATNRSDVLDPALLRPGRFDREVVVPLPDRIGREGILKIHSRQLRLSGDVRLDQLARETTGFSGADIANLCNEAALTAARHDHTQVARNDFDEALDKVRLGAARPLMLDAKEKRIVAYHESGHAVVAWLSAIADPVYKVTIMPHRQALGVTQQTPEDDRYNYNREYLLAQLAVMLGGRGAEEIAIGDITTGAESDLVQATRLARRMVTRWGMGSLGLAAFQSDEEQPFLGYELAQGRDYSEDTAARIDHDVQELLDKAHQTVRGVLTNSREKLDALVERLLQEETVNREELGEILGPRPEGSGEPAGLPNVEQQAQAQPAADTGAQAQS